MKTPKLNKKSYHKNLKDQCGLLWSECIKVRAGYKSEISGGTQRLNSHHLYGKNCYALRFSLENGICITWAEHNFGFHQEGSRRKFEDKVRQLRGKDIYDKLQRMNWIATSVDLHMTKIYLTKKLEEFKRGDL